MTLAKVRPGQPLRMSAEAFNAFIDAASAHQASRRSLAAESTASALPMGIILVRNDSGADRGRFAVLGLDDPLILPSENATAFQERVALRAVEPDADSHAERFVVLQQPIAIGALGLALLVGVTPVQLDVGADSDDAAELATDVTETLRTTSASGVRILWKEPGTGRRWGLVQLPVGGAGDNPNLVLSVSVVAHGWLVGDVLRWTGSAWALADAAVVGASDTLGVVGRIPDDDTALVVLWGLLSIDGLSSHTDYWLDPSVPGALTSVRPDEGPRIVLHHAEDGLCIVRAGSTGGGGAAERFADLTDVDVTTAPPTDGQAALWDADAERWRPADVVRSKPVPSHHALIGPKNDPDAKPTFRAIDVGDLAEAAPTSILANAGPTAARPTALTADQDDRVLLRAAGRLQWLQVPTGALADGAVTAGKLANGAVGSAAIADAAVTDGKIASLGWQKLTGVPAVFPPAAHDHVLGGQVTGALTDTRIAAGAVGNAQIADGAVTAAKLANVAGPAVLGRSAGNGAPGVIAAGAEGVVCQRIGGTLSFALLTDANVADGAGIAWAKISKFGAFAADIGAAPAAHTHAFGQLQDVSLAAPQLGQFLSFVAPGVWRNVAAPTGGPGPMAATSVWANATASTNAPGAALVATTDDRALLRIGGTLQWGQIPRAALVDTAPQSVLARLGSVAGPVSDVTAAADTILRRDGNGDLAFGKLKIAQLDSGNNDEGWVLTVTSTGQPIWNRTITLGKGAGTAASVQGALIVVINNAGDFARISSAGIELFRRSVSGSVPMVKLDLNAVSAWTSAKAMGIREIDVCENGTAKKMLVLASAAY